MRKLKLIFSVLLSVFIIYSCSTSIKPKAEILNVEFEKGVVNFDINIKDEKEYIKNLTIKLTGEDEQIITLETNEDLLINGLTEDLSFSDLEKESTYIIKVIVDYNDGKLHEDELLCNHEFSTGTWIIDPTGSIANVDLEDDTITFDVNLLDKDNTITDISIKLYQDTEPINSINMDLTCFDTGGNENLNFSGLDKETSYRIDFVVNYNNGSIQSGYVLDSHEFTTIKWPLPPTGLIINPDLENNTIILDVSISDKYEIITRLSVIISDDYFVLAELTNSHGIKTNGLTEDIYFSSLVQNTTYTISIIVSYEDDEYIYEDFLLDELEFTTGTWSDITVPTSTFENPDIGNNYVYFDVVMVDTENLITGLSVFILYEGEIISELNGLVPNGRNEDCGFTGLSPNTSYTIMVVGNYADGDYYYSFDILSVLDITTISDII